MDIAMQHWEHLQRWGWCWNMRPLNEHRFQTELKRSLFSGTWWHKHPWQHHETALLCKTRNFKSLIPLFLVMIRAVGRASFVSHLIWHVNNRYMCTTAKEGIVTHVHVYQPKPIYIVSLFWSTSPFSHIHPICCGHWHSLPAIHQTARLPPFQASTSASMKSLRVKALDESLWSCCSPMVPRNHATTMQQPPHGSSKGARK